MRTVAMSGHRPEKIPDEQVVRDKIRDGLHILGASQLIVGMAAGVDLWAGDVALKVGYPYVAAKPWATHKAREGDEELYARVIEGAMRVVNVSESLTYTYPSLYQDRNKWMVDRADVVFAIWDGSSGGTRNCVNYAIKRSVPIYRYDPVTKKFGWFREKYEA